MKRKENKDIYDDFNFRRQNLASVDVRFWRLKSIPALLKLKTYV